MLPRILSAVKGLSGILIILYFDFFALIKYNYYCLIKPFKEDVYSNIKNIQPDIAEKETAIILKKFYRYFIDIQHEFFFIKLISQKQLLKMLHIENAAILEKYYSENRNIVLMLSHYAANTNMAILLPLYTHHKIIGAYAINNNNKLENKIIKIRSKFGVTPIPRQYLYKRALCHKEEMPTCYVLFSDQPPFPPYKYSTNFLGTERYMKIGAEKIAQQNDYVVITTKTIQQKRHHYYYQLIVLTEHAASEPFLAISRTFFQNLETQVKEHPDLWMHLSNHVS